MIAGAWRWPDETQQSLQLDSTRPLKLPAILALTAALKQSLIGEQLKEGTWDPTWAPYLNVLGQVAGEKRWASDLALLQAYLNNWGPNSRSRQMGYDRTRRVWQMVKRPWPESLAAMRGNGKAAAPPEGVRSLSDEEIQELRARIQRSTRLRPDDLVAWDLLIVFGLRPAELQGLELLEEEGALELRADVEVVGTFEEAILAVMWATHQRGVASMRTGELADEVWARHKKPRKTVENTLTRIAGNGKGPNPTQLIRPQRGFVALSPREIQRRSPTPNRGVGETHPPIGGWAWDAYDPGCDRDLRVTPPEERSAPPQLNLGDSVQVRDAWRNWSNGHVVVAGIEAEGLVKVRSATGRTQHVWARNVRLFPAA